MSVGYSWELLGNDIWSDLDLICIHPHSWKVLYVNNLFFPESLILFYIKLNMYLRHLETETHVSDYHYIKEENYLSLEHRCDSVCRGKMRLKSNISAFSLRNKVIPWCFRNSYWGLLITDPLTCHPLFLQLQLYFH